MKVPVYHTQIKCIVFFSYYAKGILQSGAFDCSFRYLFLIGIEFQSTRGTRATCYVYNMLTNSKCD